MIGDDTTKVQRIQEYNSIFLLHDLSKKEKTFPEPINGAWSVANSLNLETEDQFQACFQHLGEKQVVHG